MINVNLQHRIMFFLDLNFKVKNQTVSLEIKSKVEGFFFHFHLFPKEQKKKMSSSS